ncbi:GNAT family N-acetyltransferase [Kitasatospora sp. NPDC052896]|uniref:GNAT family N-acetyltransferase n=1 Tax=Kitasatospora sp. NPDC052896 TaxID=3364061 RepID=UPI0037C73338
MKLVQIAELDGSEHWRELWNSDFHQYPRYHVPELRAAQAYAADSRFEPAHVVAVDRDGPVMGLPLTVERRDGETHLSSYGRPLYVATAAASDGARRKSAAALIMNHLDQLEERTGARGYQVRDFLVHGRLSWLSELVLRAGGRSRAYYTQEIDLQLSDEVLRKDLRRNHRRIVDRPRPQLTLHTVSGTDAGPWHRDKLHELHRQLRDREVRTSEGWQRVLDSVTGGNGFFVFGEESGATVAAAYFAVSDRYCYYGIAAHDREYYGAGLSHLVVWEGIRHARTLGCRWFEVGERVYPAEHPELTEKFHAISDFKAGFGSRVAVRLDLVKGLQDA